MIESINWGTATWQYRQDILNALPARELPDRPIIAVRARIVWATDGEEWLAGEALRLDPDKAIYVRLHDRRCPTLGAWLHPADVWWERT